MSSETVQQIPGNSETIGHPVEVVEHPVEDHKSWVSRHRRSLWGIGAVSVAIIIGVSIRSLFRGKN